MLLVNLAIFIAFLLLLAQLYRKTEKLGQTVFIGLLLGLLFGAVLQSAFEKPLLDKTLDWINVVSNGYVRLLQMIVMPLVFVSILSAIARINQTRSLGKVSVGVLSTLLITTAISAAIGIAMVHLFDVSAAGLIVGDRELAAQGKVLDKAGQVSNLTVPAMLVSFIPKNPFADLTGANPTSIISVVIFSALLGVAALSLGKEDQALGERIAQGVETLNKLVMRLVRFVIRLTPYGVFALMIKMAATSKWADIVNLGNFIVASYAAIAFMFVVHGILLFFVKVNPVDYYKKVLPTLSFAFTSRSSAATIPLNIETQTAKLGNNNVIANFAATFAAIVVLSTLGLPLELVGLLISIEPLIDMGRTALNVNGAMVAGTITDRLLNK